MTPDRQKHGRHQRSDRIVWLDRPVRAGRLRVVGYAASSALPDWLKNELEENDAQHDR